MIQTQRRFPTTVLAFTLAFFPTHLHSMLRHLFRITPVTSLLNKPARTANKSVFTTFQKPVQSIHAEQLADAAYKAINITTDSSGLPKSTVNKKLWITTIDDFTKQHGNDYTAACIKEAQQYVSSELRFIDKHNERAQATWFAAHALLQKDHS